MNLLGLTLDVTNRYLYLLTIATLIIDLLWLMSWWYCSKKNNMHENKPFIYFIYCLFSLLSAGSFLFLILGFEHFRWYWVLAGYDNMVICAVTTLLFIQITECKKTNLTIKEIIK